MGYFTNISAVFDCNISLQALANGKSPAAACFRLVETRMIKLFVSEETLTELEKVLSRNFIKEHFDLSDEAIKEFIRNLRILAEVFTDIPKVFSLPRDVDDEAYVNLAICADSDYIVTRDKDLLDLMIGFDVESKEFRQKFRLLKIVVPVEFLRIAEQQIQNNLSLKP